MANKNAEYSSPPAPSVSRRAATPSKTHSVKARDGPLVAQLVASQTELKNKSQDEAEQAHTELGEHKRGARELKAKLTPESNGVDQGTLDQESEDLRKSLARKHKAEERREERLESRYEPVEFDFTQGFIKFANGRYRYDLKSGEWFLMDRGTGLWHGRSRNELYADVSSYVVGAIDPAKRNVTGIQMDKRHSYALRKRYLSHRTFANIRASLQELLCYKEDWDSCPHILGMPSGAVDLRTGERVPVEDISDYNVTRTTSVDPQEGECPVWDGFIHQACGGDSSLAEDLERFAAYCLTGETRAEKFLVVVGPKDSGKTTFNEILGYVLGTYTMRTTISHLTAKFEKHRQWLARLDKARLIISSEPSIGTSYWRSDILNDFLSGVPQEANFMRCNSFEFTPVGKFLISCNVIPAASSAEDGILRRIVPVRFDHVPKNKDTRLKEKLRAEAPFILHKWIRAGFPYWESGDLVLDSDHIRTQSKAYTKKQDLVEMWLDDGDYTLDPRGRAPISEVWKSHYEWCDSRRMKRPSRTMFNEQLEARGCTRPRSPIKVNDVSTKVWEGICAQSDL